MARKKMKLAWMANDAARRATYKKRKKGLMKKVSELSTLCGVGACAIIYSPFETEPVVWPPPPEVQRVLARFKSLPEMEQSKKTTNLEAFLRQSINKTKEQLMKHQKENREMEMLHRMYESLSGQKGLQSLSSEDLGELAWLIEERIKAIRQRVEFLSTNGPPPRCVGVDQAKSRSTCGGANGKLQEGKMSLEKAMEALQRQPWFMEVMNPNESEGRAPFGDATCSWSNGFLP